MPFPFSPKTEGFDNRPSNQRNEDWTKIKSSERPDPEHDYNFSPCGGGLYRDDRTGKVYDWTGEEIDE